MNGMRPEDIGLLATTGEVVAAPDGSRAVYTLTTVDLEANAYRTCLWVVDRPAELDLATHGDGVTAPSGHRARSARPVTAGPHDSLPRWSPDATMLAWVARGDAGPSVRVLNVDGPGEATTICSWPDDITDLAWAPTGDRLAFVGRLRDSERYGAPGTTTPTADMPPRRVTRLLSQHNGAGWVMDRCPQLHVVPLDASAPPLTLTTPESGVSGMAWSPDGTRLAYTAAVHPTWDLDLCRDLWVVDATGGEPVALSGTTASWDLPSWSPDGSRIAALVDPTPMDGPRHIQLHVVDAAAGRSKGSVRWAGDVDRNLAPHSSTRCPLWCGDDLLIPVEDHGRVGILVVTDPAAGGASRRVVDDPVTVQSFDVSGDTLVFCATGPAEPGEVWWTTVGGRPPLRATEHGATLRARVALVEPERFTATSTDGAIVECWAMKPAATGDAGTQHPVVLNIHGGPFAQYGYSFFDEFQIQVAAGYGVVFCNPRGSAGYEESWGRAIRWPEAIDDPGSGWGGADYLDVMACLDEAIRRFDWIDPGRLGVQGGSYGGYLTSWIVGHTDRFRAAVSERAVNNLVTMEANSDISGFFRSTVGWSHIERPELYARQSPATYVQAMATPMLLVHSEDDLRCPISQAEELFVALRLLGREPELVRFPGENHELSRSGSPRHRVQRAEIILEWFDRHLR